MIQTEMGTQQLREKNPRAFWVGRIMEWDPIRRDFQRVELEKCAARLKKKKDPAGLPPDTLVILRTDLNDTMLVRKTHTFSSQALDQEVVHPVADHSTL